MAVSIDLTKKYRYNTQKLCLWLRELQNFADMKERGEEFDKDKLIYACKMCERWKKLFLESKEALGYTDRFDFMENNNFFGFSIKNGRFISEVSKKEILNTVNKWFYGYPETANHYQFEVSYYVIALAHDIEEMDDVLYADFYKNKN